MTTISDDKGIFTNSAAQLQHLIGIILSLKNLISEKHLQIYCFSLKTYGPQQQIML